MAAPVLVLVLAGFGNGTYRVGAGPGEVPAGTYAAPGGAKCAWARLGAGGRVLAKGGGRAAQKVAIPRGDLSFRTTGCGDWKRVPPATTTTRPPTTTTRPPTTTTTTTTTTTVAPSTTTTAPKIGVQGQPCAPENATAVTVDGLALRCSRTACNGFVAPRALWRRDGCR